MLKKAIAKNFNNQTDIGDIADIADDIIEKDKMDLRAEKNKLYNYKKPYFFPKTTKKEKINFPKTPNLGPKSYNSTAFAFE